MRLRKEVRDMEMEGEEVYPATVECDNCGKYPEIDIPKGVTVEEFFEGVKR